MVFEALPKQSFIIVGVCRRGLRQLFRPAKIIKQIALFQIGIIEIIRVVHTDIGCADFDAILLHHFERHVKGAVGRYTNSFHHDSPCLLFDPIWRGNWMLRR
ncbi:hypothetical protein SDC9_130044 [bioreactor metagenome]|uniref:Uncharacterized protein n=1 Tax=bioreactor metagenome TaxID=1076179 RepID=A0A645D1I0_9ZZZZ